MPKSTGGRGVKASYTTTHIRIPLPIKPEVEALIERFHAGGELHTMNSLDNDLQSAKAAAIAILAQKKSARVSLSKLLTAIYGQNVEL